MELVTSEFVSMKVLYDSLLHQFKVNETAWRMEWYGCLEENPFGDIERLLMHIAFFNAKL